MGPLGVSQALPDWDAYLSGCMSTSASLMEFCRPGRSWHLIVWPAGRGYHYPCSVLRVGAPILLRNAISQSCGTNAIIRQNYCGSDCRTEAVGNKICKGTLKVYKTPIALGCQPFFFLCQIDFCCGRLSQNRLSRCCSSPNRWHLRLRSCRWVWQLTRIRIPRLHTTLRRKEDGCRPGPMRTRKHRNS